MTKERLLERFQDFKNALERLKESLQIEAYQDIIQDIIIDGVIQRFEFTFELSWKLMKLFLEYEGIEANSPRSAIRKAYEINMIEDGEAWIDMMIDRNKISHVYDEEMAKQIYDRIKEVHIINLEKLLNRFEKVIENL
ncbi:nucleotidyltransferase substrate binding protein [Tepidibacillus fermentans]|uniref:Nucleotidyltransferase substrate binding protein (TIGR01987 family) n=1 Tax=Tepidibacillus fermentans TaxID=1281767 RepID=A0A4R3K684_9BACI|nr:nucleotidyltransferase substrate binding protein [Tepidibacillus fermentans]TCS78366.1 nucleotidyltransferase substrate binding protein (TIGR01987 family) [Tepidibacillus fermentans]